MIRWNTPRTLMPVWILLVALGASWAKPAAAQEGPAVSPAPRAGVQTQALTGSQNLQSDTVELSVNTTRAITISGYSDIIIGEEKIANVNVDPRRPNKVFIFGRGIGSTNVFFLDRRGNVVRQLEVFVTLDNGGVRDAISRLLPDEAIDVTSFRDTIFLSGNVRSAAAAQQAVDIARRFVQGDDNIKNMMNVIGSQQVVIQVRVAEMERTTRKELAATLANSRFIGGKTLSTANTLLTNPVTNFNFLTGSIGDATITALEGKQMAKTLAEPTLTALSGEKASFLSGGEVPYIAKLDSNGNPVYEYKEYGIVLGFTPTVLNEGLISMNVALEVSELDKPNYVNNVPALKTKKTDTTIDLPSGGTLMISGLLQDDSSNAVEGVPILKDIPILGALFRATDFDRTEKELVIIVTAYLASATDSTTPLAAPTDGFESASDLDIYLLGKLQKTYGNSGEPIWANPLAGPYGYIMK